MCLDSEMIPISYKTNQLNCKKINGDFSVLIKNVLESGNENLYSCEQEELQKKLIINHPGKEILNNLQIGDKFLHLIIGGIKGLNDSYNQAFVNAILKQAKFEIDKYLKYHKKISTKKIWDDYKTLLLKIDFDNDDEINIDEFENIFNSQIYRIYLAKLKEYKQEKKINHGDFPLKIISNQSSIENHDTKGYNKYQSIALSIGYSKEELEKKLLGYNYGYIDFMTHTYISEFITELKDEKVKIGNEEFFVDTKKKQLHIYINKKHEIKTFQLFLNKSFEINPAIYELFINNKLPPQLNLFKIISKTYYTRNIPSVLEEKFLDKKNKLEYYVNNEGIIIKNNHGEIIDFYDILNEDNNFFSNKILAKVRKNQLPEELQIVKKIRKIINLITIDGEFIFPEWEKIDSNKYKKSLENYNKVKKCIQNSQHLEQIEGYLEGYYKGGYNIDAFYKKISSTIKKLDEQGENNYGALAFFDIKDYGILNIKNFFANLNRVILEQQTKDTAKLNSGRKVTNIIKAIMKHGAIKDEVYHVGGDEGSIYFKNYNNQINALQKTSKQLQIHSRIVLIEIDNDNKDYINSLTIGDKKTKVLKAVENIFDLIKKRINSKKIKLLRVKNELKNNDIVNSKKIEKKILNSIKYYYNNIEEIEEIYNNTIIHYTGGKWYLVINGEYFEIYETLIDSHGNININSGFYEFLDKLGIGRELKDRKEYKKHNHNSRKK